MTTYDKLDTINDSLNDIKTAIVAKGVTPSGNITTYASAIGNIDTVNNTTLSATQNGTYTPESPYTGYSSVTVNVASGGGGWQPDPDWWDIKTILENDTRDYAGKAIILYSNSDDFTTLTISSPTVAVATSDGAFYTSTTTHTWDRSKDKIVSDDTSDTTPKYGTRYLILYFNTASPYYSALTNFRNGSIYAVFKCNLTKISSDAVANRTFFNVNITLQSFYFLTGYNLSFGTNFGNFCQNCYSLAKLPDNLDTSGGTFFASFCYKCYSLAKLPDNLDTSSGTNFASFCSECYSLAKLPDNLDTSSGTNFNNFCYRCYSLAKLPDNLDTSRGTNFTSFCSECYSLAKLPDNLDVSSGTGFSSFCSSCYSLAKLPDNLDTSSGTGFSSFCSSCYSLVKANIKLADVSVTSLSNSTFIDIQSLEYIANNAPTATGTKKLTIGSTNITRAGGSSGTIISTLTNKGWTVN